MPAILQLGSGREEQSHDSEQTAMLAAHHADSCQAATCRKGEVVLLQSWVLRYSRAHMLGLWLRMAPRTLCGAGPSTH